MNFRLLITTHVTLLLLQHFFVVETATLPGLRCQCFQFAEAVPPKIIKNFLIFPITTHCSRTEIILTVQQENAETEVCLAPELMQGKRLQKCWERIQNDPNKKRECIKKLKRRPKQSKKRGRRGGNTQSRRQKL
ncbi:C-X-C motif chemokine 3-like [Heterodontus francisci]|uniref:C-X-C motif chemokine 3-like n=1 Tax=Heterodontus francisci TaxID=7792 RepID=UPI00355BA186